MRRSGLVPIVLAGGIGGSLAVAAVVAGALLDIPGFSPRTGYGGLHALDSLLYAMSDDTAAFVTLSLFAFAEGALFLGFPLWIFLTRKKPKD